MLLQPQDGGIDNLKGIPSIWIRTQHLRRTLTPAITS